MRQRVVDYDGERRLFFVFQEKTDTTEEVVRSARIIEEPFAAADKAFEWMEEGLDNVDNRRCTFLTEGGIESYWVVADDGCCGSVDYVVTIAGRQALIGCNYGH